MNHKMHKRRWTLCASCGFFPCQRYLSRDLEAIGLQRYKLSWMIGQDAHGLYVQCREDLRADAVFALLSAQPNRLIGIGAMFPVKFEYCVSAFGSTHFVQVQ